MCLKPFKLTFVFISGAYLADKNAPQVLNLNGTLSLNKSFSFLNKIISGLL
jgi:hypothetical protein